MSQMKVLLRALANYVCNTPFRISSSELKDSADIARVYEFISSALFTDIYASCHKYLYNHPRLMSTRRRPQPTAQALELFAGLFSFSLRSPLTTSPASAQAPQAANTQDVRLCVAGPPGGSLPVYFDLQTQPRHPAPPPSDE